MPPRFRFFQKSGSPWRLRGPADRAMRISHQLRDRRDTLVVVTPPIAAILAERRKGTLTRNAVRRHVGGAGT